MISEHTEIKYMPLTALEYRVYIYHLFESLPQEGHHLIQHILCYST